MCQSSASSWTCRTTVWADGQTLSKTQWFLCFHRLQVTRITRELNPFLPSPGVRRAAVLHHSCNLSSTFDVRPGKLILLNTRNQTSCARTRCRSRCWSQKGQAAGCSRFLLASRFDVQHLSASAIHRNSLALSGAQVRHSRRCGSYVVLLVKHMR